MFISSDELQELTGYKRPADQRRWLRHRGWAFEVRGDGTNCVLLEEARSRMLSDKSRSRATEPDLSFLQRKLYR